RPVTLRYETPNCPASTRLLYRRRHRRDGAGGCAACARAPRLEHFTSFTFLALAASVMLGELFPLELPRRSGDGEVTVSTMFSFALVLGVGLLPALVAQLAASVVQDLSARKPRWQIFFNMGQYALSLAA